MSTKQRKSPKGKFLSSTALHVEPAAEPKTQYGDPAPGQGTARKHQPELAVPPAVTNPRRQGDRGNKDDGAPRLPVFVRYRASGRGRDCQQLANIDPADYGTELPLRNFARAQYPRLAA